MDVLFSSASACSSSLRAKYRRQLPGLPVSQLRRFNVVSQASAILSACVGLFILGCLPCTPSPMSTLHSLTFTCIRHVNPVDPEAVPSPTTILHLLPVTSTPPPLLPLGGQQSFLRLYLTPIEAVFDLSCLDTLLEVTFVGARIVRVGAGLSRNRRIDATAQTRQEGRITLPGLTLLDGVQATPGRPLPIMRYGIRADFLLPEVTIRKQPTSILTSQRLTTAFLPQAMENDTPLVADVTENDVVFPFPQSTNTRENRLWASRSSLARLSPYFAQLFACPPACSAYGTLTQPDHVTGTWTKPLNDILKLILSVSPRCHPI